MAILLLVLPFSQMGPIKLLKNNDVTNEFLLFKHDIIYDSNKETLTFGGEFHHAYYPFSYILSKVFYEIVSNIYINEVLLYPILITICYFLLIYSINRSEYDLKTTIITYSIVVLALGEVNGGRLIWWPYSIGYLNLIIVLFFIEKLQGKQTKYFITSLLILISIIMSHPRLPIYLIVGTAFAYYLTKKSYFISYLKLTLLNYLFWQIFMTGLKTWLGYTGYLPLWQEYVNELIKNIFSPWQGLQKVLVERAVTMPWADKLQFITSYMAIYVVYPIILSYLLLKYKKLKVRDLIVLHFILLTGIAFQVSSRLGITGYFTQISDIVIYEFFPIIMFIFASCFSMNEVRLAPSRTFTRYNKWILLIMIMIIFGSLNNTSLIYPKTEMDPMMFVDDERVIFSNVIQLAKYLNLYYNGQLFQYYMSHILSLSLKENIYLSKYVVHGSEWIVMVPKIRTIYSYLSQVKPSYNIVYDQGPWLLALR
ncbi:MAG: hypothetical protein QW738_08195 [Nitrososphaeria archaeon]